LEPAAASLSAAPYSNAMARWYVSDPCSPASILQYELRIRGIAISNFAIVGIIEVTLAGQKNDLARYRLRHYDPAD
jgi:hypothetical protein